MTADDWLHAPRPVRKSAAPKLDTNVAHIARVYDYWLGGKDNFRADREAGDAAIKALPDTVASVRANRAFLARAVRHLAGEVGIRQFLDIGTGIPAANNTHEVAQAIAPDCRIVYTDNDPAVLAHARALLTSTKQGATAYLDADLRDVDTILAEAARTLDLDRPVGLMLVAILQFIPDEEDPAGIVARLLEALPPGSHLVISHPASDLQAKAMAEMAQQVNRLMAQQVTPRTHAQVEAFFTGLDLVAPGVVRAPEWRPEHTADVPCTMWGGVARRP